MTNKNIVVALVVILVIAIGAFFFPTSNTVVERVVGSVSGPDLNSPYFSVDGLTHEYRKTKLNTATTTPCALKSPSATSTLVHASLLITTSTSTATTWTAAKAATAFATTTALNTFSLGSGALGGMVASSSSIIGVDAVATIAPNQYIVWGVAGTAVSDVTKLNGTCQAEFITI